MYHKLVASIIFSGEILKVKTRRIKSCLLVLFKSVLEVLTSYLIELEKGSNKRYNSGKMKAVLS